MPSSRGPTQVTGASANHEHPRYPDFPGYHDQLPDALAELGRSLDSVTAIVLTHDTCLPAMPRASARRSHPRPHAGHCALLAERAGVLFAGDALATVSFLSGKTGPRLVPFNEDATGARESLSRLEPLPAGMVVVGHGDRFEGTPAQAVQAARAVTE